MGMKFANDVADRACGLLEFCRCMQSQFRHRIDDAALHGFEPVADKRQRAIQDNVHGVMEIGALRKSCNGQADDLGLRDQRRRLGAFTFSRRRLTRHQFTRWDSATLGVN